MEMEFATIPMITAIVYFAVFIYKHIFTTEKALRFIPVMAIVLGLGLGILMYYIAPNLMTCATVFDAILVGCASGAAAVGVNQIMKQATKEAAGNKPSDDENGKN